MALSELTGGAQVANELPMLGSDDDRKRLWQDYIEDAGSLPVQLTDHNTFCFHWSFGNGTGLTFYHRDQELNRLTVLLSGNDPVVDKAVLAELKEATGQDATVARLADEMLNYPGRTFATFLGQPTDDANGIHSIAFALHRAIGQE